jgi:prepilin-type N-terminal cleavage/methylation domain-containing protein
LKQRANPISNTGFTLLEVITVIFLIGLVLVLYQTALGKVRLIQYAKNQEIALRAANNKIEELRSGGYAALPGSGSFSDSQLDTLSESTATMNITDYNASTKTVTITIEWHEPVGATVRNISLTTLITKTGGL